MKYKAELGMVLVTILWGANFVVSKCAMAEGLTPNYYTALRFCGAFLILAVLYRHRLRHISRTTLKAGFYIGLAVGLGYILQTIGLTMTTAAKTGFLTGLYVVLVPLFDCCIRRVLPKSNELTGVLTATVGLGVLSLNSDFTISLGDAIVFVSAVSFAVSIILISRFAAKEDPIVLATLQIGVTAVMSLILGIFTEPVPTAAVFPVDVILLTLFAVLFCTAVNTVVQNVAQSKISPTTAALILVLEPVFSGIFAFLLLGEDLGLKELTGSGLIVIGMLITLLWKPDGKQRGTALHGR